MVTTEQGHAGKVSSQKIVLLVILLVILHLGAFVRNVAIIISNN